VKRQDSAFQEPDSSKEWMFHGIVEIPYTIELVHCDVVKVCHILIAKIIVSFDDFRESIRQSFSDHVPASIDCTVMVSHHNEVSAYMFQSQTDIFLCVPVPCYVATATLVHGKVWEVLILLREAHQKPLGSIYTQWKTCLFRTLRTGGKPASSFASLCDTTWIAYSSRHTAAQTSCPAQAHQTSCPAQVHIFHPI
jgi:hypothetical protein